MRIISAPVKGIAYFQFDYDPAVIAVARSIPSHRKWDDEHKHWRFKATEPAIRHILKYCPSCKVDAGIADFLKSREDQRANARSEQSKASGATASEIRDYKFKTKPFDHQAEAFLRSRDMESFALFMEQGTGKTKVAIDNAAYLFAKGEIDSLVVACPNSVKTNWAFDELEAHLPDWVNYDVAYWEATANKKEKLALEELFNPNGNFKILIVNIEGLSTERAAKFALNFCKLRNPMLVIDESSRIKKYGAARSKTCRHMAKHCKYRRIMTGTPVTQGPLDLYSQMAVLDEHILGYSSYYSFRGRYAVMGGWENKMIIGYQNLEELTETIEPYSYRILKKDCLDIPEKIYQKVYVQHTKEQKRAYANMRKNMLTDLADGTVASASIALVKLQRFQQINSNFIKNEFDKEVVIDTAKNPRLDALCEILESHGGKAIIWARYKYDVKEITERLNKEFGRGCAASFFGETSTQERTDIRKRFQNSGDELDFFVGNPAAGGIGLTLTAASLVIYYSNDFSLESRLQSEDRAHRIGQVKNVTYIDLVTPNTIDEKIVSALRGKRDMAALVNKDNVGQWI